MPFSRLSSYESSAQVLVSAHAGHRFSTFYAAGHPVVKGLFMNIDRAISLLVLGLLVLYTGGQLWYAIAGLGSYRPDPGVGGSTFYFFLSLALFMWAYRITKEQ